MISIHQLLQRILDAAFVLCDLPSLALSSVRSLLQETHWIVF